MGPMCVRCFIEWTTAGGIDAYKGRQTHTVVVLNGQSLCAKHASLELWGSEDGPPQLDPALFAGKEPTKGADTLFMEGAHFPNGPWTTTPDAAADGLLDHSTDAAFAQQLASWQESPSSPPLISTPSPSKPFRGVRALNGPRYWFDSRQPGFAGRYQQALQYAASFGTVVTMDFATQADVLTWLDAKDISGTADVHIVSPDSDILDAEVVETNPCGEEWVEDEPRIVHDGVTGAAYVGTRADIERENERYRTLHENDADPAADPEDDCAEGSYGGTPTCDTPTCVLMDGHSGPCRSAEDMQALASKESDTPEAIGDTG